MASRNCEAQLIELEKRADGLLDILVDIFWLAFHYPPCILTAAQSSRRHLLK